MSKGIDVSFRVHPFYVDVVCFVGTQEEFKAFCKPYFADECDFRRLMEDLEGAGGFTVPMISDRGNFELIWLPDIDNIATLYHESLHAAFNVIEISGAEADCRHQELIAYMQTFIVENIQSLVEEKRKKRAKREAAKAKKLAAAAEPVATEETQS